METGPILNSGLTTLAWYLILAQRVSQESALLWPVPLTINTRYSPAWAGSWPEPPPERSATRPLRLSRSERRATRCPCRSCRLGLQATNPARASSAHPSTEFTSFLEVCGGGTRGGSECGQPHFPRNLMLGGKNYRCHLGIPRTQCVLNCFITRWMCL